MHWFQREDLQDKDIERALQESSCGGPRLHTVILYERLEEHKEIRREVEIKGWSANRWRS